MDVHDTYEQFLRRKMLTVDSSYSDSEESEDSEYEESCDGDIIEVYSKPAQSTPVPLSKSPTRKGRLIKTKDLLKQQKQSRK